MAAGTQPTLSSTLEEFERIKKTYAERPRSSTVAFLITGSVGSGKTHLLSTCPKPILIHSFDPGGAELPVLRALAEKGEAFIDTRFEHEDTDNPIAWKLWKAEFNKLTAKKVWSDLGTYAIDSSTLFTEACMNDIMKANLPKGQKVSEALPELKRDFPWLKNHLRNALKDCVGLPCHFVLTAHLEKSFQWGTEKSTIEIAMTGASKNRAPMLFNEIYVLLLEPSPTGDRRVLLTTRTATYESVRTRIGSGIFDAKEPANISDLLVKAGYKVERR